ncbi:DUF1659 domain-containing protein [Niallia sp. 01092]|uniref:DUF1659 domain-containing protein n=1 Tax=unclassified Niallia TaxID=2837522 RepID=UPI003FD56686
MAQAMFNESMLKLVFQNGVKENGEANLVSKSFRNVKETATPDEMMQVVDAIASIVALPLYSAVKNASFDVIK